MNKKFDVLFALLLFVNISQAFLIKESKDKFLDFGLRTEIWAQNNGKSYSNEKSSVNFAVETARIYFNGEINPVIQFGANLDFADNNLLIPDGSARTHQGAAYTIVRDAFINLHFNRSLNIMSGIFLDPFSSYELDYTWSFIIPTENLRSSVGTINRDILYYLKPNNNTKPFLSPLVSFDIGSDFHNSLRDIGLVLWGHFYKNSPIKYYFLIGNGKYDYNLFKSASSNLKYGFRVELTPTFLGYKGESNYVDESTYLGKRSVFTIGLSYQFERLDCSNYGNLNPLCPSDVFGSTISRAFTTDFLYEQKFGNFVPNIQGAYFYQKDLGFSKAGNYIKNSKALGYFLKAQLLYDRNIFIGKPGIAFKYEEELNQNYFTIRNNFADAKIDELALFFNYYLKGYDANISLGTTYIKPNSDLIQATSSQSGYLTSYTDYSLIFRTSF